MMGIPPPPPRGRGARLPLPAARGYGKLLFMILVYFSLFLKNIIVQSILKILHNISFSCLTICICFYSSFFACSVFSLSFILLGTAG